MIRGRALVAATVAAMLTWTGVGAAVADPNIQLPGRDDGTSNCAVLNGRAFAGYIGTGDPQPTRPIDERFATAPTDWCNTNVGYSKTSYGSDGVTFKAPPTVEGLFPYNNAEILAKPVFEPGQTMTMRVGGTEQIKSWNGTTGWGVSNRSIDPLGLEIAWFMYNGSAGLVGQASTLTAPIAQALGQDFPKGFFMMVKKSGTLVPQARLLPMSILDKQHDYAVKLGSKQVGFFVDGKEVGTFDNAPTGKWTDISRQPVPLLGQMWLDSSYWFPLPIPEYNGRWQTATMSHYRQGPSATTPLTFDN
ncbi:hypothetical protein [Gordonia terrae]|uniref:LamG domain-containing protein n=2 Tax=Gordonia terrae TaxID=2055 RepID=A0AAD0KCJ4_9ACTN|nr:hypothetical protein [Gordonia terrae]VTR07997.1 Uncharacterised protein [Clostridioides difficile]ANY25141.1 hypothetical protein BCM27_22055 [Gordonia terrae]AWO85888.1 hypothetical protein DLJ61_22285 [Gordonia terrae]VTS61866.1 Uncharacterised protein [Gordonia terrae]GAB45468.1 hypothetical protein GOTRE_125_01050 [Gordonia terrae NBRC 100016]